MPAHHEGGDAHRAGLGQGLLQQAADLPVRGAARAEVVGLAGEDRVHFRQDDEAGDLQRAGSARGDLVELFRLDQDVLVAGVVALHAVRQVDLVAGALVDPLVTDAVGGAALEPMEVNGRLSVAAWRPTVRLPRPNDKFPAQTGRAMAATSSSRPCSSSARRLPGVHPPTWLGWEPLGPVRVGLGGPVPDAEQVGRGTEAGTFPFVQGQCGRVNFCRGAECLAGGLEVAREPVVLGVVGHHPLDAGDAVGVEERGCAGEEARAGGARRSTAAGVRRGRRGRR